MNTHEIILKITARLEESGLKAIFDKLKKQFGSALKPLASGLLKMTSAVYEVDTKMTALGKATQETERKYLHFLDSANDSANRLGRSVSDLIRQTSGWAKSGFDIGNAAKLAETSSIYTNISGADNDAAVNSMSAAMNAFNIEAADSIAIVDKLNKLGREFTPTMENLGDGLSHSASALSDAGTGLDETLAMLAAGSDAAQDAAGFGDFLAISSMRLRGMKEELEQLGEHAHESADSINKVQSQILNHTDGKIDIFDDAGAFRDYYEIMEDIARIYNTLSVSDRDSLADILFGSSDKAKKQGNALIEAFQSGQVQKALDASLNAQGSAMEAQEKWLGSLEAKTQQFEAAFQSLSNTVLDSDMLKWFLDLGTGGVKALDALTDKLGSFATLSTIGGGIAGAKNLG
ncbi:MAG: phage tail tape measure protein [Lachnospiraceae bacterium]|nr:phage tail tape measure protein [Lachnospiraceae bacterium]